MNRAPETVAEVVKSGLCIGCGLCQAIGPNDYKMGWTKQGCLRPFPVAASSSSDDEILAACPGAIVVANTDNGPKQDDIWGGYSSMSRAWAGDADVRYRAATGGILTAMAQWLLQSQRAKFVLHCGPDPSRPMRSRWVLSETPEQVLENTGSRYGPTDTLAGLESALQRDEAFAIVAKPCDATAIRLRAKKDSRLNERLVAILVMVCGGASELKKSQDVLETFNIDESDVALFRYRGYGNPGPTRIETTSGKVHELTYNDMWADESGWRIQSRCKLCPDAIGESADIAASDIWPNANPTGEDQGFNGVVCRTTIGEALFSAAVSDGAVVSDVQLSPRDFDYFQPHQVSKKKAMAARLRGLSSAGHPSYRHEGLRLGQLDSTDKNEEQGTAERVKLGRFSESWPPDKA